MLQHSILLDGKEGKEVEKLLKEYQKTVTELTDLEKTKREILNKIFELSQEGTNETQNYVFTKSLVSGRKSISVKALQEQAEEIYRKISGLGLVSIGEDYYVIRGIRLKG